MGKTEGWFSELADGRLEVLLRADGHKLRASGPEPYVFALVECWEEQTGLSVEAPRENWRQRPRRGTRPMRGQLDMTELPSQDVPT
jgi:hypothetical protein